MNTRTARRRAPRVLPWLVAAVAAVILASCLALTFWTYWQENEIRDLRTALAAQQAAAQQAAAQQQDSSSPEAQPAAAQIAALQSTATALEARLAALETGFQPAGGQQQRIADLEAAVAGLQAEVEAMRAGADVGSADVGSADVGSAVAEEPAPGAPEAIRLPVARQQQSHNLSCESSAASMAAQYHGVPLTEAEVIALLPANSNPHLGFRGNVDGPTGGITDYGVYAGPIADVLNARGLRARMVSGGLEGIKSAIVAGNPVIAWVTYNCLPSTPTTTLIDGQEVTLVPNQHVLVVTGFDAGGVWANDPWDGQEDYYATGEFVRAMGYFGDMALEVARP
jgi:uncharacterized protein YvpB/HAMP domain-containing protein